MVVVGRSVVMCLICTSIAIAVPVRNHFSQPDTPLQVLIEKRDSISALMSDVMALQASHHVTAREDLIREFQTRLSALSQTLQNDETNDKQVTAQLITELTNQLATAQIVLSTTPEQLREMETLLHRSWSTGNQTAQNIENIRVLKNQFESEANSIRHEMDALRELHHERISDLDADLGLLRDITNLLNQKVGCESSTIQQAMQAFTQVNTRRSSRIETAFLEIEIENGLQATAAVPGCCATFGSDPITAQPCCFEFHDGIAASECSVHADNRTAHFHEGKVCSSIQHLYEFETRKNDVCTEQHHASGQAACNGIETCGNPTFCQTCAYDAVSDICFTNNCDVKSKVFRASCTLFDSCFSSVPSSQCCGDLKAFLSSGCDTENTVAICGVSPSQHQAKCEGTIDGSSVCKQLQLLFDGLTQGLVSSRKSEEVAFGQQLAEIQKQRHLIESNLQKAVNEMEILQVELSSTIQRSAEYEDKLQQLTQTTVAEAENRVATIPERIENVKRERQDRQEQRDQEMQLINKLRKLIAALTAQPVEVADQIISSEGVTCYYFNRPGYYYHADSQQPTQISCPNDSSCGIEKVILNPLTQPEVFLVRLGCFGDLASDPTLQTHECGASSCPSQQAIYTVECCSGSLCNAVNGEIASKKYLPGQCDPESCTCHEAFENIRPSTYPSSSPFPSPSTSLSPTPTVSSSQTPSVSPSFSATASPSASQHAFSCDAIKNENPSAATGEYEVSYGLGDRMFRVFCDMDADEGAGYTLLWKNVGGHVATDASRLVSDQQLMSEDREDLVLPAYSKLDQTSQDVSQFHTTSFDFFSKQNHTEWVKLMVLFDGNDRVRTQRVKVVMDNVRMSDVFRESPNNDVCHHTNGYFSLYSSADIATPNRINAFMGRTSTIIRGEDHNGMSSYGLPTVQENRCPELSFSNLIQDTSNLRRLTDDLQLGTNEAWETVQHIFGYDHDGENPRDFSRCMFRCWNDRDGSFHETFVWGARLGCPGFLYGSGQRCSGHGVCKQGICHCESGWSGEACAARRLEPLCAEQPQIPNGQQICDELKCRVSCNDGYVLDGPDTWQCSSDYHWIGSEVSRCVPQCFQNCSGHGVCMTPGHCECTVGWVGIGCHLKGCMSEPERIRHGALECSNSNSDTHSCHITCDQGYKISGSSNMNCQNGFWTEAPECLPICEPDNCSHHGKCVEPGVCECHPGYKGTNCHLPDCANVNQCSEHGVCVSTDVCLCDRDFDGPACDLTVRVLNDVAMYLAGNSSQSIETPSMGTFSRSTLEFWLLPEFKSGKQMLLEPVESVEGAVSIFFVNQTVAISLDGGVTTAFAFKVVDRIWTHFAFVFDMPNHVVKLYIDGQKMEQVSVSGDTISVVTSRIGGTTKHSLHGFVKELRVWRTNRSSLQIATEAYEALTGAEENLETLYALNGPLSANTIYLDDLTGRHGVRISGGLWLRAPTAPPGPRSLPPVYHNASPPS